jgi:hypothetical protein
MDDTFKVVLCSVMTSASPWEHMWIEGWIHNKLRNRLTQPNVKNCSCSCQPRPQEDYTVIQVGESCKSRTKLITTPSLVIHDWFHDLYNFQREKVIEKDIYIHTHTQTDRVREFVWHNTIHPSVYISMVHHDNIYVFSFDRIFVCGYVLSWCMCVCMCTHGGQSYFLYLEWKR